MDFLKDLSIDKVRNLAEDAFNQAKPKSDIEARMYEVLSHKNWGSSSSLMNEIARDTFDYDKYAVISQLMWESMEQQRPAAWRVVFKGLTLLEHLIKNGNERCVDDARNHGHTLRALFQFNYYEGTIDRGSGVREKAKQLVDMLADDERIREERQKARKLREKFGGNLGGVSGGGGIGIGGGGGESSRYAGYGNDDWTSSTGGGGYAEGGIGSERFRSSDGGGGGGGRRYDSEPGGDDVYSGRYDDDREVSCPSSNSTLATAPTPTFASLPELPKKSKTKKKKKQQSSNSDDEIVQNVAEPSLADVAATAAPASEVDLFGDFDTASTSNPGPHSAFENTTAAEPAFEDFHAFQSSVSPTTTTDPFISSSSNAAFPMENGTSLFDGFGNAVGSSGSHTAHNHYQQNNQSSSDAFHAFPAGGGPSIGADVMGGGDDDFGDFTSSVPSASSPMNNNSPPMGFLNNHSSQQPASSSQSINSMSKLISLDGLTKNNKMASSTMTAQRLNAPIVANQAAASYVQEQNAIQQSMTQGRKGNHMGSFVGIDGLGGTGKGTMGGMNMSMPNMSFHAMGSNESVMGMGKAGGSDAISNFMDPHTFAPPKSDLSTYSTNPLQQSQAGSANTGGMNAQMMQQMMANMTPQQCQQMMMMIQMQQQQQQGQGGFGAGGQQQHNFGSGFNRNAAGGFR